jgi:flagellar motor protein MotB
MLTATLKRRGLLALCVCLLAAPAHAVWPFETRTRATGTQSVEEAPLGEAVERHLPNDEPYSQWVQDPDVYQSQSGDMLETRDVLAEAVETVKLTNLVPPIRFASGAADIPASYVEQLRVILDGMRDRRNVRLHLVGHADPQRLSERLADIYGDNLGLSRERAGVVAEYFQHALLLPPEAISYEGVGDTQPIASNATSAGRALNRRVEVEVWYDEVGERITQEEFIVAQDIKRVKVCRVETVCTLRYREGHARRARVRNLIAPFHFDDETTAPPDQFIEQIQQALHNLGDKRNVVVKLIGYMDDVPLTGRTERIYGTHLGLSKARAHRVALAVQDALQLPTSALESDGRGAAVPLASNETEHGRALNRRVEVEFWHDDPLRELPDEPQLCPDAVGAELITRVYDPPWGSIAPLHLENGRALIPANYAETLRRAMEDVAEKTNVRLRFVGYTSNERLDRRTAGVYVDDVGLSAARARRAMEAISQQLALSHAQAEYEGRGYLHSDDVINAGFIQGDSSHVVVQVVYDELAVLDDYEGVDVTRITRELRPQNPFALNQLRITVDGKPIDDPGKSMADIQRCTDVALENADIQFRFDNLGAARRLNVTASPTAVVSGNGDADGDTGEPVRFSMYANYLHFIERAEVRVFDQAQSLQAVPLDIVAIGDDGLAAWHPAADAFAGPVRELKYVLRVYDSAGKFDETRAQPLWIMNPSAADGSLTGDANGLVPGSNGIASVAAASSNGTATPNGATTADGAGTANGKAAANGAVPALDAALLAGFGESRVSIQNIPLSGGAVKVHGEQIPPQHSVWVAGRAVPVDEQGKFVVEQILPAGYHTVEVAVLDQAGNGELFLRDLEFKQSDWFYVGIADLTLSGTRTSGPADLLAGDNAPFARDSTFDGRLAFYLTGKYSDDVQLTASADTREGPVKELFSNFMSKSPDALFRRIDPDYHYPTFGDDGTVQETAPTLGRFYVKLNHKESYGLWGNFKIGYMDNELAHVDRGLYGGNVHYESTATTSFGEQRLMVDAFAAEPGTVPAREEFRGTGGSLYFLRRQDILVGSERVRIEVRDKDSGLVTGVASLQPSLDYDIDYLQGRILLSEPLSSSVDDRLLVRSGALAGDEAHLVVRYEYTPGIEEIDTLAAGGRMHYWFGDHVRIGFTSNINEEASTDSNLHATDITLRRSTESWFKLQGARSEGIVSSTMRSDDGGFGFSGNDPLLWSDATANAYRADISVGFGDFLDNGKGRLTLYLQEVDGGYSAPGMAALTDTEQYGGTFGMPLTDRLHLRAKADSRVQDQGLETTAQAMEIDYQLTHHWSLSAGVRNERRDDHSPVVPLTQEEGGRTDAVVQAGYDSRDRWRAYGFVQETVSTSGNRDDNARLGAGGAFRVTERLRVEGEVSDGDLGTAGRLGSSFLHSDRTSIYLNYALENEQTDNGLRARKGNLITGIRTRLSDSASVYLEERYQHSNQATGLTHATGVSLAPTERLNVGANADIGTLKDRQTGAEIERTAIGVRLGYGFDAIQVSSGIEYRQDETEQLDTTTTERTTWLFRNNFKYQVTPDWRLVGKLNHAESESSQGQFYDGGYTEAVLGFGFRPIRHDRLNALAKYTYFYNVPASDQVTLTNSAAQFIQKSHVAALDLTYDLTRRWSIGGKYAYRLGQVSLDREHPEFFDSRAQLYILRTDWRFGERWEALAEARMLDLIDINERRSGALIALYRHVGSRVKLGAGYNFTDFSDDLTDLDYRHHGFFVNLIGTL